MPQHEMLEANIASNTDDGVRKKRKFRVLSISGGGTRGIIPSLVLLRLEQITGHHVIDMFDLMIGTSTGAMICAVLTIPQKEQVDAKLQDSQEVSQDASQQESQHERKLYLLPNN